MRSRLVLALILSTACFKDSDQVPSETSSGGGESSGGANPVDVCRACQMTQCADYAATCAGDAECNTCVEAPFDLGCLANPNMHALGSCSCEHCATECDYLCPGGEGACNSCGIQQCGPEGNACISDPACAPCIDDAFREGCAENPLFMAAQACNCMSCGQECIWECPEAGNACAGCISSACGDPFGICIQDEMCADCFASPYLPGCADNMAFAALAACGCGNCTDTCGLLFECGG
jgi:hypothetical protein